jgi:hypothetical protein
MMVDQPPLSPAAFNGCSEFFLLMMISPQCPAAFALGWGAWFNDRSGAIT